MPLLLRETCPESCKWQPRVLHTGVHSTSLLFRAREGLSRLRSSPSSVSAQVGDHKEPTEGTSGAGAYDVCDLKQHACSAPAGHHLPLLHHISFHIYTHYVWTSLMQRGSFNSISLAYAISTCTIFLRPNASAFVKLLSRIPLRILHMLQVALLSLK